MNGETPVLSAGTEKESSFLDAAVKITVKIICKSKIDLCEL